MKLRYAISVIEIPVEVKPDGTYTQLTDRMRIEFRKTTKDDLPTPQPPPKTVDWFKVFGPPEPEVECTDVEPEPIEYNPDTKIEELDLADIEPVIFNVVKRPKNPDRPLSLRKMKSREITNYSRRAL